MAHRDESDDSLMVRIQRGEHGAFSILVRRHTNLFFTAAYRMCGHVQEAEDIVQEAFLKLWDRPEIWDAGKGAKFTTWFYRVVTNLAIDRKRKEKTFAAPEAMESVADLAPAADDQLQENELQDALERAIQSLPDRQKAALNLCFYGGLSNKEAAGILGVSIKALESLLMRAKAALQGEFLQNGLLHQDNTQRRRSHA